MSRNQWQIGTVSDINEDDKTRPIGSYRRYQMTERADEMLAMPENTATGTGTDAVPERLPVWALAAAAGVGVVSCLVSAVALLWLLV